MQMLFEWFYFSRKGFIDGFEGTDGFFSSKFRALPRVMALISICLRAFDDVTTDKSNQDVSK